MVVIRLKIITILILSLLINIILELIFNSVLNFYPKVTLWEHIQSSLKLKRLIGIIFIGLTCFVLLFGILITTSTRGIFNIYIALFKFFELILPLIDIINLLLIYQYKIKYFTEENSSIAGIEMKKTTHPSMRFFLSLNIALIRLIINIDIVREKFNCTWKRKVIILFDLLLSILININFIRYSTKNLFRIGRKIILPILIYQLNGLLFNETFYIDSMKWNRHIKQKINSIFLMKSIFSIFDRFKHEDEYLILKLIDLLHYIQWIILLFFVYLFACSRFQLIIIDGYDNLFSIRYVQIFLKSHGLILMMCIIIPCLLYCNTLQNKNVLDQYGFSHYFIGFYPSSGTKSNEIFPYSSIQIKTTIAKDVRSSPILMKKKQQTCSICYEDKNLDEFDDLFTTNCGHLNRSLCNSCLFRHVQQVFQITFTDDIYCPESDCRVRFDYSTVKSILFLNGDDKLVERYDRYVLHRQLEQMDEFIWCSNVLCNVGQINEGGALNNIVTCFNCHQKTCFTHKIKWHDRLSCKELDMSMDPIYESSRRWIVENSKKCPNCPYQIEKNNGCDHMTCIKCRHEFCWSCLADFQPIRKYGNHRHNPTCKHYVSYK
ncbi:unnamed protein product [Rotaria sp. Silwood2]|nr:unnamed protein product [Rotaria sp. Silwood2]